MKKKEKNPAYRVVIIGFTLLLALGILLLFYSPMLGPGHVLVLPGIAV